MSLEIDTYPCGNPNLKYRPVPFCYKDQLATGELITPKAMPPDQGCNWIWERTKVMDKLKYRNCVFDYTRTKYLVEKDDETNEYIYVVDDDGYCVPRTIWFT